MRFSRSFCLFLTEFFLSIRTEISVRSLPLCQILQIFTVNFQRYFRSKYKFCKFSRVTRSLNLHLREPGVLAQARAISGPGRARQEAISSHLKRSLTLERPSGGQMDPPPSQGFSDLKIEPDLKQSNETCSFV